MSRRAPAPPPPPPVSPPPSGRPPPRQQGSTAVTAAARPPCARARCRTWTHAEPQAGPRAPATIGVQGEVDIGLSRLIGRSPSLSQGLVLQGQLGGRVWGINHKSLDAEVSGHGVQCALVRWCPGGERGRNNMIFILRVTKILFQAGCSTYWAPYKVPC